jgi:hypothetical protein
MGLYGRSERNEKCLDLVDRDADDRHPAIVAGRAAEPANRNRRDRGKRRHLLFNPGPRMNVTTTINFG